MGSYIEINDTLQITTKQGFPKEFNINKHLKNPYKTKDFKNKVFSFHSKSNVRIFHASPIRVFWVQKIKGKWLYWGLIEIIELTLDMVNKTTSGKYRILKIFSPEEMQEAEKTIHFKKGELYFSGLKRG